MSTMGTYKYRVQFEADTTQFQSAVSNLQSSLSTIAKTPIAFDSSGLIAAKNEAQQLSQILKQATNVNTGKLDISKFSQQLKASGKDLSQYAASLQKLGSTGQQAFMQLAQSIGQAHVPIRTTNRLLQSLGANLLNVAKWQISSTILTGFISAISSAVQYSKDLNKNLNDIRIVSGESASTMDAFAEKANKAAKALSTTTNEYAKASLIFYQQGLNAKEVEERTEAIIKMANVTGESADNVSSYMTAIWNNFDNGSKSLEYYADVMTALGAATASSTDEIAIGLEKFAGIAEIVGLSYEYATTALATLVAQTRQSPETVGTALKTIFSRLQGLKLGETLEDGTNLNKYSEALAVVGVNIKDSNGALKDMDQILNDLGQRWDLINKDQQMALAQTVGGIRQYTQLITLMDNWDTFKINLDTAENAEGELNKQAEIYAESWEAASNRAKASLESLYAQLVPEDQLIELTNLFSGFLDSITEVVDNFGGLGPILLMTFGMLASRFLPQIIAGGMTIVNNMRIAAGLGQKQTQDFIQQAQVEMQKAGMLNQQNQLYQQMLGNTQKILELRNYELENAKSLTSERKREIEAQIEALNQENALLMATEQRRKELQQMQSLTMGQGIMYAGQHGYSGNEAKTAMANLRQDATFSQYLSEFGMNPDSQPQPFGRNVNGNINTAKDFIRSQGQRFEAGFQDAYGVSAAEVVGYQEATAQVNKAQTDINNYKGSKKTIEYKNLKKALAEATAAQEKFNEAARKADDAMVKNAQNIQKINGLADGEVNDLNKLEAEYNEYTNEIVANTEAKLNNSRTNATEIVGNKAAENTEKNARAGASVNAPLIDPNKPKGPTDQELFNQAQKERSDAMKSSIQGVTSALMGASMAIQAIQSLGSIWSNDDLSVGEKWASTIMSVSMALGGLMSTASGVGQVMKGVGTWIKKSGEMAQISAAMTEKANNRENKSSAKNIKFKIGEAIAEGADDAAVGNPVPLGIALAIGAGVAALIGGGIALTVGAVNRQNAKEMAEEDYKKFSETKQKAEENDTNTKEYKQLFQAHEELQQEQGESLEASDELKKKVEELSDSYDLHSGVIANLTGDYSNFNKELKEAIDNENKLLKGQAKQAQTSLGKSFGDKIEAGAGGEWDWWQRALIGIGGLATAIGGIATANPYLAGVGTATAGSAFTLPEGYNQSSESFLLQSGIISEDLLAGYQDILSYDETTGKINVHFDSSDSEEAARYAAFLQEYSLAVQSSDATKEQIKNDEFYQEAQTKIAKIGDEDMTKATDLVNSLNNIELETISNEMFGVFGENAPKTIEQMETLEESFIAQANTAGISKQAALDYLKALPETSDLMKTSDAINNMFDGLEDEEELKNRAKELYDVYGNIIFDGRVNLYASEESISTMVNQVQNELNEEEFRVNLVTSSKLGAEWKKALASGDSDAIQKILDDSANNFTEAEKYKLLTLSPEEGEKFLEERAIKTVNVGSFMATANYGLENKQNVSDKALTTASENLTEAANTVSKNQEAYDIRDENVKKAFQALDILTEASKWDKEGYTNYYGNYNNDILTEGANKLGITADGDEDAYAKALYDYARNILGEDVLKGEYSEIGRGQKVFIDSAGNSNTYDTKEVYENGMVKTYYAIPTEDGYEWVSYEEYPNYLSLPEPPEIDTKGSTDLYTQTERDNLAASQSYFTEVQKDYDEKVAENKIVGQITKNNMSQTNLATLVAGANAATSAEQLEIIYKNTAKTIGPYWDKMQEFYKDEPLALQALIEYEDEYRSLMDERVDNEKEYAELVSKDQSKLSDAEKDRLKELNTYFGTDFPVQLKEIDEKYGDILDKNEELIKQVNFQKDTLSNFETYEDSGKSEYERDTAKAQIMQDVNNYLGANVVNEDNWNEMYGWIKAGLQGDEAAWDKVLEKRNEYLRGVQSEDGTYEFTGLKKELRELGIEFEELEDAAKKAGVSIDDLYNPDGTINFSVLSKLLSNIDNIKKAAIIAGTVLGQIDEGVPDEIVVDLILNVDGSWQKQFLNTFKAITNEESYAEFNRLLTKYLNEGKITQDDYDFIKDNQDINSWDVVEYIEEKILPTQDEDADFAKGLEEAFKKLEGNFGYTYESPNGGSNSKYETEFLEPVEEEFDTLSSILGAMAEAVEETTEQIEQLKAQLERATSDSKGGILSELISTLQQNNIEYQELISWIDDEITQYADIAGMTALQRLQRTDTLEDAVAAAQNAKNTALNNAAITNGGVLNESTGNYEFSSEEGKNAYDEAAEALNYTHDGLIEAAEDALELWNNRLGDYESLEDSRQEYSDAIDENTYAIEDYQLEQIQIPLNNLLTSQEKQRAENEANFATMSDDVRTIAEADSESTMLLEEYTANQDLIALLEAQGIETAEQEELHNSLLIRNNEIIGELYDNVKARLDVGFTSLEEAREDSQEQLEALETIASALETLTSLVEILPMGLSESKMQQKSLLTASFDVAKNQIISSQNWMTQQRNIISELTAEKLTTTDSATIDTLDKQIETIEDAIEEQENSVYELALDAIEKAKAIFDFVKEETLTALEEVELNGIGQNLEEAYNDQKTEEERYLDTTKQEYELSKLERSLSKEISLNNQNLLAQSKLLDVMSEIEEIREKGIEMSEYDLQMLNARFELRKAEIAFEEAQQNKSQARLVRNAQGNWSYVFTANQTSIDQAAQTKEDAEYNWKKISQDNIKAQEQNIINAKKTLKDELDEIYSDTTLTSEEASKKASEAYAKYEKTVQYSTSEMRKSLNALGLTFADTTLGQLEGFSSLEEAEKAWLEQGSTTLTTLSNGYKDYEDNTQEVLKTIDGEWNSWARLFKAQADSGVEGSLMNTADKIKLGFAEMATSITKALGEIKTAIEDWNSIDEQTSSTETDSSEVVNKKKEEINALTDLFWDYFNKYMEAAEDSAEESEAYFNAEATFNKRQELIGELGANGKAYKTPTFTELNNTMWKIKHTDDIGEQTLYDMLYGEKSQEPSGGKIETPETDSSLTTFIDPEKAEKSVTEFLNLDKVAKSDIKEQIYAITEGFDINKEKYNITDDSDRQRAFETLAKRYNNSVSGTVNTFLIPNYKTVEQFTSEGLFGRLGNRYPQNYNLGELPIQIALDDGSAPTPLKRDIYLMEQYPNTKKIVLGLKEGKDIINRGWLTWDNFVARYPAYDTGGYTGDWNSSEGKLAVLHEKEIVLNKADTKNLLSAVEVLRGMSSSIAGMILGNAGAQMNGLSRAITTAAISSLPTLLQQEIHIDASFPGVTSAQEIENALNNIINDVAQYAEIKNL